MLTVSKVLRRSRRLPIASTQAACAKLDTPVESKDHILEASEVIYEKCRSFPRFYQNFSTGRRAFSSKANAKRTGEEDELEDGFSDLEAANSAQDMSSESDFEDESISEDDNEETQNELDPPDAESGPNKRQRRRAVSELFKAIIAAPGPTLSSALDRWVEEGKELTRPEISAAMLNLRRRRMFGRALQLSEWLEANKKLEFNERDYASRLDLIAKIRGIQKAEAYIEKIPKSFRGEVIYRTLLANCVAETNVKKAEDVFNKMKDLEFPITSFACDQLLLLYKRVDKKKIADVLLLMEKENVKPSAFTYKILIDTKGLSNDITGMDQIVETMKDEGVEPDLRTQAMIAKHYASAGLDEKAEKVLKEMEGEKLKANRRVCGNLLPVYAQLGKADEVDRIWKICEPNPRMEECMAVIIAYGQLNQIKEAEAVFERMLKTWKKVSSKCYSVLLKVYVDHKMLSNGKDLVKKMADSGLKIGPLTWDALVRLYVEAGEVGKADSILNKAAQQNQMKPLMNSYMVIMDEYAKRGDVHNTEKIFHRMRQVGYVSRLRQFQALVQAYINAKSPAYGMRQRMKADNIFPNKPMAGQLAQVDPFKKTAVSDLLD